MANETRTNDALTSHALQQIASTLPDTKKGCKTDLNGLLASLAYISKAKAEVQTKLLHERARLRYPKDKELTDWDRKIMLDDATAELQAEYDLFTDIQKALEQRVEVVRALLVQ